MELEYPFLENKPILPDDHNTMTHIDACYRNQKEMVKDEYVAAVLAGHPKCNYILLFTEIQVPAILILLVVLLVVAWIIHVGLECLKFFRKQRSRRNPVAIYQRCISDYSPTPNRSTEFSNERTVVHV